MSSVHIQNIYPLTPMQEGMLYHSVMDPESDAYFLQNVMTIEGDLDIEILKLTVDHLIKRFDVFRTVFVHKETERPLQIVLRKREAEVHFNDLTDLEISERTASLDRIVQLDLATQFQLDKDLLLRIIVVKMSEKNYKMIWSIPHIVIDGWSLGIVSDAFYRIYQSISSSNPVNLFPAPQFGSYLTWLKQQDQAAALHYWQTYLHGYEQRIELPGKTAVSNGSEEDSETYRLESVRINVDKSVSGRLEQLCKQYKVTLGTLAQTIWGLLLQRYNNTDDVVFGSVISGRPPEVTDVEKMVGLFVNTVPLRVRKRHGSMISEVIADVQMAMLQANRFGYMSLADIQSAISYPDLIDHLFVFENYPSLDENEEAALAQDGKGFKIVQADVSERTNYNFHLTAAQNDCLSFILNYNANVYDSAQMHRTADHIQKIIEFMSESWEISVDLIDILAEDEKQQLLDFNRTVRPFPKSKTVVDLLREQASLRPDAAAVCYGTRYITYAELVSKSSKLAGSLRSKGVGPNTVVGLMAEQSIERIIGMFAVMEAGGAYLPLDPSLPEQRKMYMLNDANAQWILSYGGFSGLSEYVGMHIPLETWEAELPSSYFESMDISSSEDLAYIMYTSGTTGLPKGVMIKHSNISRLVMNTEIVPLNDTVKLLQTGSFSFDVVTFEIFGALLNGGCLQLVDKEVLLNPQSLANTIDQLEINTMFLTTQLFHQLSEDKPSMFKKMKYLLVGGEVLASKPVHNVHKACPELTIINVYGPTENTAFSTSHVISRNFDGENIPIGKPLTNSSAYIVSKEGHLQPLGVPGELWVGGDGIGRGYINKSKLTNERFIDNPFGVGRIYRTGDLAQWNAEGTISYIGRMDQQIKIRGFRIELGEIEQKLRQHPEIKDAVVLVFGDKEAKYLSAYIVATNGNQNLDNGEIKKYLAVDLPEYMIPKFYIQLSKLPLTPNGKVDRKALPEPEGERLSETDYVAPQNETEREMLELWEDVLGLTPIGVQDNFFSLGGHSLKAMNLVSRINRTFKTHISIRSLMENPTTLDLIRAMEHVSKRSKQQSIVSVNRIDSGYYPLSHAQQRIFMVSQFDSVGTAYHIPYVLKINGKPDLCHIQQVLQKLVDRHESLRTSFHINNGKPVQRINNKVDFHIENINERVMEKEQNSTAEVLGGFVRPFDLSSAPLIRAGLASTAEDEHYLALDIHHIIADGAAVNVLMQEFVQLYTGQVLSPLELDYVDYVMWQNTPEQQELLKQQKKYWTETFSKEVPVLQLPVDYPRRPHHRYKGSSISFNIEPQISSYLRQLATKTGTTMYMICMAAYSVMLYRYTGQEDIVIGTPVAGRPADAMERTIGMFVNTLPLRSYPVGGKTFRHYLSEVKKNILEALENDDYPLEELIEDLQLPRQGNRNPLFDTMFVLQNADGGVLTLDGTGIEITDYEQDIAKFDLIFTIVDDGDQLQLTVEYSKDLYKHDTAERTGRHYINLLRHISCSPDRTLESIEMLDEAEREVLLNTFNDTRSVYPRDEVISDLFDEQALCFPDRQAITCNGQTLTYSQLKKRADHLAVLLQKKGVAPDQIVGIYAGRSFELIVGILGILKAGGAFLILDKSLPLERIHYLLGDSRTNIVLLDNAPTDVSSYFSKQGISTIDINMKEIEDVELEVVQQCSPSNLAYVMYTSGSTGEPKGVMIEQRNIVRLVKNTNYLPLNEHVRIMQTGALGFDAITFEIFGSLLNGGGLCLVDKTVLLDAVALSSAIATNSVNTMWLTSSLFNQLIQNKPDMFAGIDYLIVGGEALSPKYIRTAREANPKLSIINGYGPTENTTFSTSFLITENFEINIPIGKPIANSTAYILSRSGALQPIGVFGELYVSGDGVGRGYINKPVETEAKFMNNPFENGTRMYKTGDLARWLPDGTIEYGGRMDHQVKIRGHRIELGEIEYLLSEHPSVKESVLVIHGEDHGKHLCAYIISERGQSANEAQLLDYLSSILPDYMIPSHFIFLDEIPLTSNGKVDRHSLPEPNQKEFTGSVYASPTNELERTIATEWERALGGKAIGIHDNFFAIGGQSLKAMELVASLQRLGLQVNISHIFEEQTIARIAKRLENTVKFSQVMADLNSPRSNENIVLTSQSMDERETIDSDNYLQDVKDLLSAEQTKYHQQIMSGEVLGTHVLSPSQRYHLEHHECSGTMIRLNFRVDIPSLKKSLLAIIRNQRMMRSSLRIEVGEAEWIEYEVPTEIELPIICIVRYNKSEKDEIWNKVLGDFFYDRHSFDRLPYRIALIKEGEESFTLLLPFSHIIFDYMSSEILRRDLVEQYMYYIGEAVEPAVRMSDYWQYHQQISRGPVGLEDDQLFKRFALEEFHAASKTITEKTIDKDKSSGTNVMVTVSLDQNMQMDGDMRWSFSMMLISRFLCMHLETVQIPAWLTHFGRRYEKQSYYDIVGEFIDHIPLNIKISDTLVDMQNRLLPCLHGITEYNLHFMNLIYNEEMHLNYPKSSAHLRESFGQLPIVINYLGQLHEDHNELEYMSRTTADDHETETILVSIRYTNKDMVFSISLPYRDDPNVLQRQISLIVPELLSELSTSKVSG